MGNKAVILDTNFILVCAKQKIHFKNLINEFLPGAEIIIPKQVNKEIENIKENKKNKLKIRDNAKLSLMLTKGLKEINLERNYVDKGIIEYCKKHKEKEWAVATIDKKFKKELTKNKIRSIYIRNLKNLEIG